MGSQSNQKKTTSHSTKHRAVLSVKPDEDKDIYQKLNQTLELNKPFFSQDYFSIFSTPENKDREQFKFNSGTAASVKKPSIPTQQNQYYSNKIEYESVSPNKEIPKPSVMVRTSFFEKLEKKIGLKTSWKSKST